VLRAATANTLVLLRERRQRFDRAGKIAGFEGREAPDQRGKVRARRVTPLSGQLLYLTSTGIARRIIYHDSLHEQHMQISEPIARPWQCAVRIGVQPALRRGVARLTGEFGAPQKRRSIGDFLLRPAAVPVERDRIQVQSQRFCPIAGLDFTERQVPA
jgi:hypothetical protein